MAFFSAKWIIIIIIIISQKPQVNHALRLERVSVSKNEQNALSFSLVGLVEKLEDNGKVLPFCELTIFILLLSKFLSESCCISSSPLTISKTVPSIRHVAIPERTS